MCTVSTRPILFFLILIINTISVFGQITGNLTYSPETKTYLVSVIPNQNLSSPQNITNTAQITLKATSGSFDISSLVSLNGIWTKAATINSPIESPNFDYHVFILGALLTNPTIEAGLPIPLFSFSNNKECQGSIELVNNFSDEFWPPNSMDANIGNQLTVVGFGNDNAYEKNDELASKIECPRNLEINLSMDTLKCAADSTSFSIEILDGDLPFIYSINLENGNQIIDSLTNYQQPQLLNLPVGNHNIDGYDQSTSFTKSIAINNPTPLRITIVEKKSITCHNPTGVIKVQGTGGLTDNYQYKWSNGESGSTLNQLTQGFFTVSITDDNNCTASKSVFLEGTSSIRIDSIEMYHPTCNGDDDGIIEMLSITNGQPPFEFTLNDNPPQKENYFDNLGGGSYQINVTDAENCVTSKRVTLNAPIEIVKGTMPRDTFLVKGERIQMRPTFNKNGPLSYNWTPNTYLSCDNCASPMVQPPKTTILTLTITTPSGCERIFENQITVLEKTPIFVPNIFYPASNDENRYLSIFLGPTIQKVQRFQVFNRWGQLMYNVQNGRINQNIAWDGLYKGEIADSGVYIYVLEVLLKNQKTEIHTGDVFLKK